MVIRSKDCIVLKFSRPVSLLLLDIWDESSLLILSLKVSREHRLPTPTDGSIISRLSDAALGSSGTCKRDIAFQTNDVRAVGETSRSRERETNMAGVAVAHAVIYCEQVGTCRECRCSHGVKWRVATVAYQISYCSHSDSDLVLPAQRSPAEG